MECMFYGCNKLTSLDLANFSTDRIINMLDMFGECYALAKVDDSNFNSNTLKIFKLAQIFSFYINSYK